MSENQNPSVKLQGGGSASILSYSVPETIAYTGRNFIELQFGDSYFVHGSQAAAASKSTQSASKKKSAASAKAASAPQAQTATPVKLPETYRSMSGEIVSLSSQPDEAPSLMMMRARIPQMEEEPIMNMRPREEIDPYPEPEPEPEPADSITISIVSPAPGGTIIGLHTGAPFTVTGKVSAVGGTAASVQVKVGANAWQTAQIGSGGNWTLSNAFADAPGPVVVRAVATHSNGFTTAAREITVHVTLLAEPDKIPPTIQITSPTDGFVPGQNDQAVVTVRGTASDNRAMSKVEISVNNGAYVLAESGDGWANWSKQITLPSGTNNITARATDAAGNPGTASVTVSVDMQPPTVKIATPVPQAELTGVHPIGVNVEVTGTASDANGIRSVEISLNNNPMFVAVQPKAPGDWSTWKGSLSITEGGIQFITARCTDNAGNKSETTIPVNVTIIPDVVSSANRLFLVEKYMLSTFLGNYGAGRTLKTYSLLPGEKSKISIKTYQQNETQAKAASSILDSFSNDSATDFETSLLNEQSDQKKYLESFKYTVDGEAKASWGWGSAKISAGVSSETNGARDEFAKNISNSIQKHAAKASSQREVQVNTSSEQKSVSSEESSIIREIENINTSRTLNFVFRQMNQEYISILHLVDIRIGYYHEGTINGEDDTYYREVPLTQLNTLLNDVVVQKYRSEVKNAILYQLTNIFDYQDRHQRFVEEEPFRDEDGNIIELSSYLRVRKELASNYYDAATDTSFDVPGIILAANKYVMRTEGIVVDALLGQGEALDSYSRNLQDETIRGLMLKNDELYTDIKMRAYALQILQNRDELAAKLFGMVNPSAAPASEDEAQDGASKGSTNSGVPVNS